MKILRSQIVLFLFSVMLTFLIIVHQHYYDNPPGPNHIESIGINEHSLPAIVFYTLVFFALSNAFLVIVKSLPKFRVNQK